MANDKPIEHTGAPELVGNEKHHVLSSPHDLTEDVDAAYAGEYMLTVGTLRIPQYDSKGELLPRGKVLIGNPKDGPRLKLNAVDAHRFLIAGTARRVDGKRPDRVERAEA